MWKSLNRSSGRSRGAPTCGNNSEPFSPMSNEPAFGNFTLSATPSRSRGGYLPAPSYQVTFTVFPAVRGVPGKSYSTTDHLYQTSRLSGDDSPRMNMGAVSPSAMNTGSRMWQPKSPSWPLEKSCHARQFHG